MNSGKKELRTLVRERKAAYTAEELGDMSRQVCRNVCSDGLWRSAGTVLLYYPLGDEVDVRPLIRQAVSLGHKVLLPCVVDEELELRVYAGEESLRKGAFGILEPTGPVFPVADYAQIHLALVPGVAFDARGNRLGRGKGFYDRLLPQLPQTYKLGICFPFQKFEEIPSETFDVPMDEIIS